MSFCTSFVWGRTKMPPGDWGSSLCCPWECWAWGLRGSGAAWVPGEGPLEKPCQRAGDSHWHCCCSWWRLKWSRGAKQRICFCCRLWSFKGAWLGSGFNSPGSPLPPSETQAGHVLGWELKKKKRTPASFKIDFLCFIPFLFLLLSPPSLPPTLWSGGKGIFITLIRSPVLGCPFEVWFPASSGQERILGTAGFLSLFLCMYKYASLSFLFFCFICLCFPLLSKPASLPQTGSPPPVDHYHSSNFLLQHLRVILPFPLLCLILSILPSFSFQTFLKLFS